jgi:hypothetical protein
MAFYGHHRVLAWCVRADGRLLGSSTVSTGAHSCIHRNSDDSHARAAGGMGLLLIPLHVLARRKLHFARVWVRHMNTALPRTAAAAGVEVRVPP